MHDEPRDTPEIDGDSSDVVTGPVGNAHLVEPAASEPLSADLDQLPTVEVPEDPTTDAAATPRR